MSKTIDARHVAELYEEFQDRDDTPEAAADSDLVAGWSVVGSALVRTSRWHERRWLVLCEVATGETWGVEYGIGLTEDQEDELPWAGVVGPIGLVRLYEHQVTETVYRITPPTEV